MEKVNGEMVHLLLVPLHLHCASHLWIHVLPTFCTPTFCIHLLTCWEGNSKGGNTFLMLAANFPQGSWEADRKLEVAPAVTDFF